MARKVTIAALTVGYDLNSTELGEYRHPGGIQLGPTFEDNLKLHEQKILEAGRDLRADFVCFTEGALSTGLQGDEAKRAIVDVSGPEVSRLAAAARQAGVYAIVGLDERADPRPYNSGVLLGPHEGVVGTFRKVHLTPGEHRRHAPGHEWPVFETRHGKVGIQICYDYYFPEAARSLALGGAEIIFCPTENEGRGVEQAVALQKARAIDNAVYYVSSVKFCGGHEPHSAARSVIIDPVGVIRADSGFGDGWAVATVDLDEPYPQVWAGIPEPQNMRKLLMKCRRPETYGRIVEPKEHIPWDEVILTEAGTEYPEV